MRFIGSKQRLLTFLARAFESAGVNSGARFGDLFSGTAAVSGLLKRMGFEVVANDNLRFCYYFAVAVLSNDREPTFSELRSSGILGEAAPPDLFPSTYEQVLTFLEALPGVTGFITEEYADDPDAPEAGHRRYFAAGNARRIDAIRGVIAGWASAGLIGLSEESLLLSDLIRAANRVANIAGTYGCFLKHWEPRALSNLNLRRSTIAPGRGLHTVYNADANSLARKLTFDAVYLDPPYTWRHYGAYYHIPETIAYGDRPFVTGQTGLRPWEASKSNYCDRERARSALTELIESLSTKHIFLSYSSEGLISHEEILETLRARGEPRVFEVRHRRYRSSDRGAAHNEVRERLYYVCVAKD
jgi:adenine-specific DNA-methyltransferase